LWGSPTLEATTVFSPGKLGAPVQTAMLPGCIRFSRRLKC
jgi:hypothetical protein